MAFSGHLPQQQDMASKKTQDALREPSPPSDEPLENHPNNACNPLNIIYMPIGWLRMLCRELNTTFVLGLVVVYGASQGFSSSIFDVAGDFYWKDVQKVQPSTLQLYNALYYVPWVLKPLWGMLTDVFPILGYRRRPYFLLAGFIGSISAMIVAIIDGLVLDVALLCMVGMSAAIAIAEVTIGACIARNGIERPEMVTHMQSLCGLASSIGEFVGYVSSGISVHLLGAQSAMGLMGIHSVLLMGLGLAFFELRTSNEAKNRKRLEKMGDAVRDMHRMIKFPQIWKPSLYMFVALALNISIYEGKFYWYTDEKDGPSFSKEIVGMINATGVVASVFGVIFYQMVLKDMPFRPLISYTQLLFAGFGMLDVALFLRWNLKLHISDYIFVVVEECLSRIVGQVLWQSLMVLSNKLCPVGNEGTFFALLMCINSLGNLLAKFGGGAVLGVFHVTRYDFQYLWLVVLVRNLLRLVPLGFIFLLPQLDQSDALLPVELLKEKELSAQVGEVGEKKNGPLPADNRSDVVLDCRHTE